MLFRHSTFYNNNTIVILPTRVRIEVSTCLHYWYSSAHNIILSWCYVTVILPLPLRKKTKSSTPQRSVNRSSPCNMFLSWNLSSTQCPLSRCSFMVLRYNSLSNHNNNYTIYYYYIVRFGCVSIIDPRPPSASIFK